ncbi:MAG: hypothetical protein PHH44_05615 [bacterium]|nr:hypothetical protein [bacterium]
MSARSYWWANNGGMVFCGATIEWKTDQPATSKIYYTLQQGTWTYETTEDTNLTTDHRVDVLQVISGLKTYWYRIYSKNSIGSSSNKGEDYSLTFITPN